MRGRPRPNPDPGLRTIGAMQHFPLARLWRAVNGWVPYTLGMRTGALRPAIIQVGPPFAEHRHTSRDAQGPGTVPVHFGESWKFAETGQSQVVAPSVSSLLRHAQQAHSLLHR